MRLLCLPCNVVVTSELEALKHMVKRHLDQMPHWTVPTILHLTYQGRN